MNADLWVYSWKGFITDKIIFRSEEIEKAGGGNITLHLFIWVFVACVCLTRWRMASNFVAMSEIQIV